MEYPFAPKGGLSGRMAVRQALSKDTGGTRQLGKLSQPNLLVGPPLGAPRRCVKGAFAPPSLLPTALWGIQKGKADGTRGDTGTAGRAARPPGPSRPPTS